MLLRCAEAHDTLALREQRLGLDKLRGSNGLENGGHRDTCRRIHLDLHTGSTPLARALRNWYLLSAFVVIFILLAAVLGGMNILASKASWIQIVSPRLVLLGVPHVASATMSLDLVLKTVTTKHNV